MQIRTDMAAELTKECGSDQTSGIRQNEYEKNGVKVSVTDILSDSAEEKTGKERTKRKKECQRKRTGTGRR